MNSGRIYLQVTFFLIQTILQFTLFRGSRGDNSSSLEENTDLEHHGAIIITFIIIYLKFHIIYIFHEKSMKCYTELSH